MLPGVLVMLHRIHDYVAEGLEVSDLTFAFKGPWFSGMNTLVTADPANIHHAFNTNFSIYDKGPEFKEIFDFLGEGIFTADSKLWEELRRSALVFFSHQRFQSFSLKTIASKIKNGLVPVLDHFAEANRVFDLQDVLHRFTFDVTLTLVTGYDTNSLSIEMKENEYAKAIEDVEEVMMYRHVKPMILWKLQNWMGLGVEKKMIKANVAFDRLCAEYISTKRKEIQHSNIGEDMLSFYMKLDTSKYKLMNSNDDKFLKDIIKSFMIAGSDAIATTLTWFFWLLSNSPEVVTKIRQEINTNLPRSGRSFDPDMLNKMVYLHGALCETLRLYPPVPFERKTPIKQDVLPSGHKVDGNWKILFAVYALGRMRAVWGEDASEFKPERWISKNGSLKHEPSFKFFAFNSGPRNCMGKNLSFWQMKTVAIEIIQNYDIKTMSSPVKRRKKKAEKKSRTPESTPNLSLPDDFLLSCFTRISRLYYLTLSLVSKSFGTLLTSPELYKIRSSLGNTDSCLYVCLKFPPDPNPRWFTLCQKPTLPKKKKSSGYVLATVSIPYSLLEHCFGLVAVGSNIYNIGGSIHKAPLSSISILDCRSHTWCEAPNMRVERSYPVANVLDGKIYVAGGCKDGNASNWMEVFDPITLTWEHVLCPFADICEKQIGRTVIDGNIYLLGFNKGVVYKPKEKKWETIRAMTYLDLGWSCLSYCGIDNVLYCYSHLDGIKWYKSRMMDMFDGFEKTA
ncbi:hypothetical protein AALP_AA1G089200 [Arabis alpina]|uniref:Uncharacterized protein n=1 Tax=Arabis alpina TaxID=50452 RepID=A0A087HM21_ARAAL|nr:hypothetical protein AALP_AA1G089200 [Arabis alpina]